MSEQPDSWARMWDEDFTGDPGDEPRHYWFFERNRDGKVFGPYGSELIRNSIAHFFRRLDEVGGRT